MIQQAKLEDERLEGLLQYMSQLEDAGLDDKLIYDKYIKVCDEVESELGIK